MYRKNPKHLDTQKSNCKHSIIVMHLVMDPQDADGMVNNVDLDQTAVLATSRENVSSEIFDQLRFKPACSATKTS